MNTKVLLSGLALMFGLCGGASAAPAGEITLLTGRGTAVSQDGTIRPLNKGDAVYSGEVVNSGVNSYLNIKFADGGFILLRPNSRFEIENFAFAAAAEPARKPAQSAAPVLNPPGSPPGKPVTTPIATAPAQAGTSRAFFRLLKGGFRAVSGLVGKVDRNEYRVSTPVATIGIRGTDYVVILCDTACASDPVVGGAIPQGSVTEGGVVVGVISGGVFVSNQAGGGTQIGENQYLVNLPDGRQLNLPFEPRFLRVDPIPNPKNVCAN